MPSLSAQFLMEEERWKLWPVSSKTTLHWWKIYVHMLIRLLSNAMLNSPLYSIRFSSLPSSRIWIREQPIAAHERSCIFPWLLNHRQCTLMIKSNNVGPFYNPHVRYAGTFFWSSPQFTNVLRGKETISVVPLNKLSVLPCPSTLVT